MSFVGEVAELPIGTGGFNGAKNVSQVRPDQLIQADTVTLENNILQKEGGASLYNSSAITGAPQVMGGWDWYPTSTQQRMVVVCNDSKIYKDSGAGTFATTLKTLTNVPSRPPFFVEGGNEVAANSRKLFIFTGNNPVQVLAADGATTADIATPPADWSGTNQPSAGFISNFRLWGYGNLNDPHRLYYSTTTSHEDMTTGGAGASGSISVFPGEGDRIAAAIPFKGHIIVFKYPKGIYDVDVTSSNPADWGATRLSQAIGVSGAYGIVNIDDDILFIDPTGIFHKISAVREFGDFGLQSAGDQDAFMTPYLREVMNLARMEWIRSVFYIAKREVQFTFARTGNTANTARLVVDLNDPTRMRFRYSYRDSMECLWVRKDSSGIPRLTGGDQAGFVWNMDQTNKVKNNTAYVSTFQTPHYDLSHIDPLLATKRKGGVALELVVEPKGNWTLGIDVYWDGRYYMSTTFNMGVSGAALGSFVLDTDVLGQDQVLSKIRRIVGSGRRISLVGTDSGSGTDFSIARAFLKYKLLDERISK